MPDIIEVKEVSKTFESRKERVAAIKPTSFTIRKGEIVGLIGENGAGKTTLLRMICTLLTPCNGAISINGLDTNRDAMKIKSKIGVLFGGETGLYDRLTPRENLTYFSSLYGLSHHETKSRIDKLAVQFGIKEYLDRKVQGFSRGMRQKVSIARALVHDPDIILFDEPTTGLDITAANMFRQVIHQMRREGKTIIFSSHIMEEVTLLCSSVMMLHKGELVYQGTLEQLYEEEQSNDLNYIFMSRLVRGGSA